MIYNKISQACTAAQENTSKLIENAISQALNPDHKTVYPQKLTHPGILELLDQTENQIIHMMQTVTVSWQTNNCGIPQHLNGEA